MDIIFFFISEKHGTCSYPVIQDEYSYFSTTLHLYSSYNVTVSNAYHFHGHSWHSALTDTQSFVHILLGTLS
jgi:hypothetical protein